MKKIILSLLLTSLSAFAFGQSIQLSPQGPDEITVTTYGSTNSSFLGRNAGGTPTSPTFTPSGSVLSSFVGRGHTGTSFTLSSQAYIAMYANQNFSPTALGSYMTFGTTANNTVSQVERMRITHDGKIAIGSHTPLTKLHIRDAGASGVTPTSTTSVFLDDNTNNYLGLASTDATETGILFGKPTLGAASGGVIYDNTNMLQLRTGGNNTRMVISSSGLIGIGNTSPTGKLHITHTGSDSEPHLNIQATTGALGRIRWTTATNTNSWIAQTNLENTSATSNYWRLEYNSGSRLYLNGDGRLGIGSDAPTAKLHVEGDIALSKITSFPVNGGYNDLDRQGSSILRFQNGGIINGIAGGADGMILYIFNTNSSTLTINNQNTGSLAANRIITHTGGNFNLSTVGGVTLIYDGSSSRWRIVSVAQ